VNLTVLTLVCFACVSSVVAVVGLALRDLLFRRSAIAGNSVDEAAAPLPRLTLARDVVPTTGLASRIDQALERLVLESGVSASSLTVTLFLVLSGLIFGGGVLLWTGDPVSSVIGFLVGMGAPLPYLSLRRAGRIRDVQSQLADAMDLMSRATRAGESLDQAIALVGERSPEPLGLEFRRCARHLQMGLSVSAAMRALVHRLPIMDIRILATTLSVHRQAGGNLALTLERMARVVRDRMSYRQQIRSVTAAGRFSAMLIATVGPLLFLYLFTFERDYVGKLLDLPLGNLMLAFAVVLEIVGLVWISRLIRTEY
jgi:tight adherence protein B